MNQKDAQLAEKLKNNKTIEDSFACYSHKGISLMTFFVYKIKN